METNNENITNKQPSEHIEEEVLYYESSDNDNEIDNRFDHAPTGIHKGGNSVSSIPPKAAPAHTQRLQTETEKADKRITMKNLPFGHMCDDIPPDDDTPYIRLYCQNVNGIFDREGIGLDGTFKEIKQAGADIFTFNETHGDESNASARCVLRLSKQRMWRDNN